LHYVRYLDIQQQVDRLQSIVLRLASNIDTLNHQTDVHNSSQVDFESNIKHEQIEDEPSELEIEEDHEDETSDVNPHLDFPASTSTNLTYPIHPIPAKNIVNKLRAIIVKFFYVPVRCQ
jgi:hypothetical protein